MSVYLSVGLGGLFGKFYPGIGFGYEFKVFYTDVRFYQGFGDYDLSFGSLGLRYSADIRSFRLKTFVGISAGRYRVISTNKYSAGLDYGVRMRYRRIFVGLRGFYDLSGNPLWIEVGLNPF